MKTIAGMYTPGLISVVMACYNGERYLPEALESVLGQSYADIELIIVDDGSTDGSGGMIGRYTQRYREKVIALTQENRGPSAARNAGLKSAKGEYVAFLDTDDWWDKECLKKLHGSLVARGADIAYCGWQNVGRKKQLENQPYIPPRYEEGDLIASFLKSCPWPIHAALTRRAIIDKVGGFSERRHAAEDYGLWLGIAAITKNIVLVPEVLAFYRWHVEEVAYRRRWVRVFAAADVQKEFIRDNRSAVGHIGEKALRALVENLFIKEGYEAFWDGDLASARRLLRKAFFSGGWGMKDLRYMLPALLPEALYSSLVRHLRRESHG